MRRCDLQRRPFAPPRRNRFLMFKYKVAQVIGSFGGGGAERAAFNIGAGIAALGEPSTCISIREAGDFAKNAQSSLEVIELGVKRKALLSLVRGIFRLRRILRSEHIALLHVHGQDALLFCVLATIGTGSKLCFTWHNSSEVLAERGWKRRLMLWSMQRCSALFGSSNAITHALRKALPRHPCIETFRNGVVLPHPDLTPSSLPQETPTILWMGRLVPDKDPLALIAAATALRDTELRFRIVIAGDAPPHLAWYKQKLLDLIREKDLGSIVHLAGWIKDPSDLLARASIGVQTSHTEGLSLALLEQMTYGLPVVATDVGDSSDAVLEGTTGFLIPPRDHEKLVHALRHLICNPAARTTMGAASYRRIKERFDIRVISRDAWEKYGRIIRDDLCLQPLPSNQPT
jgi:glycosyltransferase involved in cell wall biosynthesis